MAHQKNNSKKTLSIRVKISLLFGFFYLVITVIYPAVYISHLKGLIAGDLRLAFISYIFPSMLMALIMTYITAYWITKPLTAIKACLRDLIKGQRKIYPPVGSGDEIESLAHSVLRLRESLHIAYEVGISPEVIGVGGERVPRKKRESILFKIALGYFLLAVFANYMVMIMSYYNLINEPITILLFALFLVVYLFVVTLYITDIVVRPIERIAAITEEITKGRFERLGELQSIKTGDDVETIAEHIYILGLGIKRACKALEGEVDAE